MAEQLELAPPIERLRWCGNPLVPAVGAWRGPSTTFDDERELARRLKRMGI